MSAKKKAFKGPVEPGGEGQRHPPPPNCHEPVENRSLVSGIKAQGLSGFDLGDALWLFLSHLFSSECCFLVVSSGGRPATRVTLCQAPARLGTGPLNWSPVVSSWIRAPAACRARLVLPPGRGVELLSPGEGALDIWVTISFRVEGCRELKGKADSRFSWVSLCPVVCGQQVTWFCAWVISHNQ